MPRSVSQCYWLPFYPLKPWPFMVAALTTWVYTPMVMVTLGHSPTLTSHSTKVAHVLLMRWLCHKLIMCEFFLPVHFHIPAKVFQENVCFCQNCSWIFCDVNFWIKRLGIGGKDWGVGKKKIKDLTEELQFIFITESPRAGDGKRGGKWSQVGYGAVFLVFDV